MLHVDVYCRRKLSRAMLVTGRSTGERLCLRVVGLSAFPVRPAEFAAAAREGGMSGCLNRNLGRSSPLVDVASQSDRSCDCGCHDNWSESNIGVSF
ncbi:MAG: hypothetical protein JWL77_379 [Chthonomonadaceae bacterium]|nr:hypothetical protein [Chthonomonadaceae bacterium]